MVQEETRQEKLTRLLTKNKTKLARTALAKKYKEELNYQLAGQQFFELTFSNNIKRNAYQRVRALHSEEFPNFRDVMTALELIKGHCTARQDDMFILFYLDTMYTRHNKLETGGIKLPLKDFWNILHNLVGEPQSDIILTNEFTTAGICIEPEEHCYLLTFWGI